MTSTRFMGRLLCASLLITGSVVAKVAYAEETAMIEEVVVTARRREESVQDVPIRVTALTAELENTSIRSLSDLTG